jgi:poly(hydroxyalkanoate) depolymerase family esterase
MRGLAKTVARLTALSRETQASFDANDGRLDEMSAFGSNPGQLGAKVYIPEVLHPEAPLVVVLHGCTQNAAVYDKGSGWSQLADRYGFALLFPEQRRTNNSNLCFNWYDASDARRGVGEAKSIAQMVQHMTATYGLDASKRYITGLSAGGAMTAVMLATYPELFAGGAIIAGLPFATANSLPEALERMRGQNMPSRRQLAAHVESAAPNARRTPTLSVWHGTNDGIVSSANAIAIVDQWRDLHRVGTATGHIGSVDGHRREVWRDPQGKEVIEKIEVRGMGHGTPLDTRGANSCGTAGPHMLEAGICSTRRIAEFWELTDAIVADTDTLDNVVARVPARPHASANTQRHGGVGAVIENALRTAGLMS